MLRQDVWSKPKVKTSGGPDPSGATGAGASPRGDMLPTGQRPLAPAFAAYHNIQQRGGNDLQGGGGDAQHTGALERNFFPLQQRRQLHAEMAAAMAAEGGRVDSTPHDPNDYASYGYTSGAGSTVFASLGDATAALEERRAAFRERHRQAYAALASVKPFLQRLFDDGEDPNGGQLNADGSSSQWDRDTRAATAGSGSSSVGDGVGGGGGPAGHAAGGGGDGPMRIGGGGPDASAPLSSALYGRRGTYQRVSAAAAGSLLPSMHYDDVVQREIAKPLILQTVVSTDRCPLTTKTCAPTFATFNLRAFAETTRDEEAMAYAAHVEMQRNVMRPHASKTITTGRHYGHDGTAASEASSGGSFSRAGGGGAQRHGVPPPPLPTSVSGRHEATNIYSVDVLHKEPALSGGVLTSGALNPGMRVFRDFMLTTSDTNLNDCSRTYYYDEKKAMDEAQLRFLRHVIQDSQSNADRNHLAAAPIFQQQQRP